MGSWGDENTNKLLIQSKDDDGDPSVQSKYTSSNDVHDHDSDSDDDEEEDDSGDDSSSESPSESSWNSPSTNSDVCPSPKYGINVSTKSDVYDDMSTLGQCNYTEKVGKYDVLSNFTALSQITTKLGHHCNSGDNNKLDIFSRRKQSVGYKTQSSFALKAWNSFFEDIDPRLRHELEHELMHMQLRPFLLNVYNFEELFYPFPHIQDLLFACYVPYSRDIHESLEQEKHKQEKQKQAAKHALSSGDGDDGSDDSEAATQHNIDCGDAEQGARIEFMIENMLLAQHNGIKESAFYE